MPKLHFLIIALLSPFLVFGQQKSLLEDISIEEGTVLVGMYQHSDKSKTYEKLNFKIDDLKVLNSLKGDLVYGQGTENFIEFNGFNIKLLKNNVVVKSWIVNPAYSNIIIDGKYYQFDSNHLKKLAKKYPLSYEVTEHKFNSLSEFQKFEKDIHKDMSFLYMNAPRFKYEGKFDIKFMKDEKFSSPKAISQYLSPEIEKIANGKEFLIYYAASDYNISNPNQYTMTIEADYALFQALNLKEAEKQSWIPSKNSAMIFKAKK